MCVKHLCAGLGPDRGAAFTESTAGKTVGQRTGPHPARGGLPMDGGRPQRTMSGRNGTQATGSRHLPQSQLGPLRPLEAPVGSPLSAGVVP